MLEPAFAANKHILTLESSLFSVAILILIETTKNELTKSEFVEARGGLDLVLSHKLDCSCAFYQSCQDVLIVASAASAASISLINVML